MTPARAPAMRDDRMTTLFLLRHAHAGDSGRWTGDDALRPLSDKGRRQSDRIGRMLAGVGEAPDLLITSPKVRAAQTAEVVAKALNVPVVEDRRLEGPLDAEVVGDILAAAGPATRPCLVGHDPDFSSLLGELLGWSEVPMRKGALARVDFESRVDCRSRRAALPRAAGAPRRPLARAGRRSAGPDQASMPRDRSMTIWWSCVRPVAKPASDRAR